MSSSNESYDGASVVARLAGLVPDAPESEFVTPERLVSCFCNAALRPVADHPGASRARGFCGFNGSRGGPLETGFDDGYDYLGYLDEHGWRALDDVGNWPYDVWVFWPARDGQPATLAQYLEGDLTVWQFESYDGVKAFLRSLLAAA